MKKTILIGIAFIVALVGVLLYSTMSLRRYRVEVCMEFAGRKACRTAAAATREQALRAATENACALIAPGMTDSIACGNSRPASVNWKE